MSRATLVGAPGSGRTVALSLLYASLVRYGGEKEGHFRFHAEEDSLQVLGSLYEQLRCGEMPLWPETGGPPRTTITLSYDGQGAHAALSRAFHPLHHVGPHSLRFALDRFSNEDLQAFVRGGGGLTAGASDLLDTSALICVLDASQLPIRRAPDPAGAHAWDATLGGLVRAIAAADRDHPAPPGRRIQPIFLLTKMDGAPEPARASFTPPDSGRSPSNRDGRRQVAERLVEDHLPGTKAALLASDPHRSLFAPPTLFASWVTPDDPSHSSRKIQGHATSTRGWEPDYPFPEYADLIEELGLLAAEADARGVPP